MPRYIVARFSSVAIMLVAILAGCAQSPIGLFESIALERAIVDDRELDNDLLVSAIAESDGRYFIAAATIWNREVADPDYPAGVVAEWALIGSPESSNFTTTSLVAFGGLIYAAYSSQNGTEGGVYVVQSGVTTGDKVFGTDNANVASVGRVFVANDGTDTYLLIGVRKSGTISQYGLYASTTGVAESFAEVVGVEVNLPVIDVAESAAGAVAFLTRKSILIDGDGLIAGPPTDVTGNLGIVDRQPEFGGIYFDPATDTLWVTDNEGYLYRSGDFGTTWAVNDTAHAVSISDEDPLQFTDMAAVDNGGSALLVVGTQGHGYRELDDSFTPATPAAKGSNYQASALSMATVLTFYVDPSSTLFVPVQSGEDFEQKSGDLLFAGTSNLGLWKVLYSGDAPQWVRE